MGVGYPGSTFFEEMSPPMKKDDLEKLKITEVDNFSTLWYMIHIPKERVEKIRKEGNSLLALYFLIKECGADQEWQDDYDYYMPLVEKGELIGHSGFHSYFLFEELKEAIKKMVGIEGTKGIKYSDFLKSCIKEKGL